MRLFALLLLTCGLAGMAFTTVVVLWHRRQDRKCSCGWLKRDCLWHAGRAGACLLLLLCACRPAPEHDAPPAGRWLVSPAGHAVMVPAWLDASPELFDEALLEIATSGLPPDWRVVIEVPVFATTASPTGLARGETDYEDRTVRVGWRFSACEDRPLLPALGHERDHVLSGPEAGH